MTLLIRFQTAPASIRDELRVQEAVGLYVHSEGRVDGQEADQGQTDTGPHVELELSDVDEGDVVGVVRGVFRCNVCK